MKFDRQFGAVLLCFALSGFAALLYQTAWLREFAFVFGTADLAVVSVLAAYMAGLAIGSAIAARVTGRIQRPILVYGLLELAIALCALAVPAAIRGATALFVWSFGSLEVPPEAGGITTTLFFTTCSLAILVVPTALMGVTLPLLARHAVRSDEEIGRRIGVLYAVNTGGAVAGTLCAAFLLLPTVGLRTTVYFGAATNIVVFAIAVGVARFARNVPPAPVRRGASTREPRARWVLVVMAISGMTSFGYEVLWTRLLGHLLGGSVHAFSTMLASFLLGITFGSAIAARFASSRRRAAWGLFASEVGAAALSLAAFAALDGLPTLAQSIGASSHGSLAANVTVAAAVLLPGALCFGATFPFAVRLVAHGAADAAPASARVYAWNTTGSIVGALLAGLVALPALGFAGLATAAASVNLALAAATAWLATPRLRWAAIGAGLAILSLVSLRPDPPWRILRTNPDASVAGQGEIAYFGVGRSATVLLLHNGTRWNLTTNGLNEASIDPPGARPFQAPTTRWLALLPALARPGARSVLLIGLGGGLTLQAVPHGVEEIEVIELEPEVVAANRAVARVRDVDPLADPRVSLRVNDARGALLLTGARYDAIISQPSHPWTAGASHLYTREFFSLVRDHLAPGGVFAQWMGLRFVDADLFRTLVATLLDTFPHVRVYQPTPVSAVFLASDRPLDIETTAPRALRDQGADFARFGLRSAEDVAAGLVLDDTSSRELAAGAAINTDHRNVLATRSPRLLRGQTLARGADELLAPFDPLPRLGGSLDPIVLTRRILSRFGAPRAMRYALTIEAPTPRALALGWIDALERRPRAARRHFDRALELDPASEEARSGLLLVHRRRLARSSDGDLLESLAPLALTQRAVAAAWRARATGDLDRLASLDAALAEIQPRSGLFPEATRLRAGWRVDTGDRDRAAEAVFIMDALAIARPSTHDLSLRARAAVLAGEPLAALATLEEMIRAVRKPEAARAALAILADLPADFRPQAAARMRQQLERWIQ